jgi:hypothetical protein
MGGRPLSTLPASTACELSAGPLVRPSASSELLTCHHGVVLLLLDGDLLGVHLVELPGQVVVGLVQPQKRGGQVVQRELALQALGRVRRGLRCGIVEPTHPSRVPAVLLRLRGGFRGDAVGLRGAIGPLAA